MKKVFYVFALLTLPLMSCESDSDNDVTPTPSNDDSILPTKLVIEYSDNTSETVEFTYDGKKLTKETSSDGYYTDYIYTDDKLTEINYYDSPNPAILETYTYDNQGKITTISTDIVGTTSSSLYNVSYNNDSSIITFTHSDSIPGEDPDSLTIQNGNITTYDESGFYISEYTYDSKNAPFKNLESRNILVTIDSENNDAIYFTLNNLLTEEILDTSDSSKETSTYTYTYTQDDFPRKITDNYEGDITTYTYTYNND